MDKNTITGFLLIAAILVVSFFLNKPSEEELKRVEEERAAAAAQVEVVENNVPATKLEPAIDLNNDSIAKDRFGSFASAVNGEEQYTVLENNLIKMTISNLGGKVVSVEVKDYKRHDGSPLVLFEEENTHFGFNFFANNRPIATDQLYFTKVSGGDNIVVTGSEVPTGSEGMAEWNSSNPGRSGSVVMELTTAEGEILRYSYTLPYNSYMVDFEISSRGYDRLLGRDAGTVELNWSMDITRQERHVERFGEDAYTAISYKFSGDDDVDKLAATSDEVESLSTSVDWIAYKQLFFTSALIAPDAILGADLKSVKMEGDSEKITNFSTNITFPLGAKSDQKITTKLFFGPNRYKLLDQYDNGMVEIIDLGWKAFSWVNKWIVIPAFDFLSKYISNYGLIILLLTIYVKLIIFPFTFRSYKSQAKMKALKPELDELKEKFGPDKQMEAQQATMALYKKAGVSPMGGCIPQLFQMPILFAMFRFFPVSIELRQKSFLWADDLSTYDSIVTLPFDIPFYGDHVSLFCLMMAFANFFYMKANSSMTASPQMPGMKMMYYMMPIMLLFFFNSYAAGLSYYYFLSLVITFGQMYIFKAMIDEDEIRAQINRNKKKPAPKKSKFQQRLEDMQKQQKEAAKKR